MQVGPYTLRDYQLRTRNFTGQAINDGLRWVDVCMPTGAGKTIFAISLIAGAIAKGKNVIFAADRRVLISQVGDKLERCGIPYTVCMDGYRYESSNVVLVSKDTAVSRMHRLWWQDPDLIIIDESHTANTDKWHAFLDHFPGAVRIGLSATPIDSMAETIIHGASYDELLAAGALVPYRHFSPKIQTDDLAADVRAEWIRLAEGRPTIVFWPKVEQSVAGRDAFNEYEIPSAHVDGETSQEEREEIDERIRSGELLTLHNVGVYTTGYDNPMISCACFAFKTASLIKYRQCGGRILRPHPGKEDAIILDFFGNVYEHGWVTRDIHWTVDDTATIEKREHESWEKDKKENPPVTCSRCGREVPAREFGQNGCPGCGHMSVKVKGKPAVPINDYLVEIDRKKLQTTNEKQWLRSLGKAIGLQKKRKVTNKGTCVTVKQALAMHMKEEGNEFPKEEYRSTPKREHLDWPVTRFYYEVVKG